MPRTMKISLTEKAERLREFWRTEHRTPSFSEMMAMFGYKSKNAVFCVVNQLVARGYLAKDGKGHLSFLPKLTGSVRLLGSIAAGFPVDEEEQVGEAMTMDEYLVRDPDHSYLLTVRGESMIGAGILPGDVVLVERNRKAAEHDIVVACVDGEWTLKYYEKDVAGIRLDPANPKFKFIRPKNSLTIGGVVRAVIRRY